MTTKPSKPVLHSADEYFAALGPPPEFAPAETQAQRERRRQRYLDRISPARHLRYSPNLHAFLSKPEIADFLDAARAYRTAGGTLLIGLIDDRGRFQGQRLATLLDQGEEAKIEIWPPGTSMQEQPEFWLKYEADGRCAIDPSHTDQVLSLGGRWRVHGRTRSCAWCQKVDQNLEARERIIVEEIWVTAP